MVGGVAERLTSLVNADDRFTIPYSDLRAGQVEALNERFQERKGRIKLLAFRAKEAGIGEIRSAADMVPLEHET